MKFRVLGPLEVEVDRRTIVLGRAKERRLLAMLLLHANETVSTERLVDALWGEQPPPTAAKLVQTYVSHLRKAVPGVIETRPSGYVARVGDGELDLARFTELADRAWREPSARAASTLAEALALWRGPALEDVALAPDAARLDDLRLDALARRIDADLELGRHEAVIHELRGLIDAQPYRERFHTQLMLALYRSGRQTEALDAYRRARATLAELGLEPSRDLRDLERRILNQDATLTLPRPVRRLTGPRGRRRAAAVGAAAAVAVALGVAAFVASADQRSVVEAKAHSVARVDARRAALVAAVPAGRNPLRVAAAGSGVWVVDGTDGTVIRIDPRTGEVVRTISVAPGLNDVTAFAGAVWALAVPDDTLIRIDPASNHVTARIRTRIDMSPLGIGVGFASAGLAAGKDRLYVNGLARIWEIDARRNRVTGRIAADGAFAALAVADDALWTADVLTPGDLADDQVVLQRRDLRTGTVTGTLALAARPVGVIGGGTAGIWVVERDGLLLRIDAFQLSVTATVTVGGRPTGIARTGGDLWITDAAANELVRVDADRMRVVKRVPLGAEPAGIAAGSGALWIALPYPRAAAAG